MNTTIFVDFKNRCVINRVILKDEPVYSPAPVPMAWNTPPTELDSRSNFQRVEHALKERFNGDIPEFVTHAWNSYQNEPYLFGCVHNLIRSPIKEKLEKIGQWLRPQPWPMLIREESDTIGRDVAQGGSDPLMWMDQKYRVTWHHIKARIGKSLTIHTRSDLIAHDDYLAVLDRSQHKIVMYTLSCDDDHIARIEEPGAPSLKRRMAAVEKLRTLGFNVTVRRQRLPSRKVG